jgi:hypothetical protein
MFVTLGALDVHEFDLVLKVRGRALKILLIQEKESNQLSDAIWSITEIRGRPTFFNF